MQGTIKFIDFAISLDLLLEKAKDFPSLQQEMYLYHSYWFSASKALVKRMLGLLSSLKLVGGEVENAKFHLHRLAEPEKRLVRGLRAADF